MVLINIITSVRLIWKIQQPSQHSLVLLSKPDVFTQVSTCLMLVTRLHRTTFKTPHTKPTY